MTHSPGETGATVETGAPARSTTLSVARSRWRGIATTLGTVAVLLVVVSWWATHPPALPVRAGHVTAVTTPDRPVYVGLFSGVETDRTLRIGGVHLHTDATVPVSVEPLLCRGGSVSVTSDAATFCRALVDPTGEQLRPGDSILVRVSGTDAGAAFVGRMTLTYRSGLRVATQPAGTSAVVAIVPPTS